MKTHRGAMLTIVMPCTVGVYPFSSSYSTKHQKENPENARDVEDTKCDK